MKNVLVLIVFTVIFAEALGALDFIKKKGIIPIIRPRPTKANCTGNVDCGTLYQCRKANCETKIGVCTLSLPICLPLKKPVCGCDGLTYNNACMAQKNRTNVDYQGACQPAKTCMTNNDCAAGTNFCRKAKGLCNGKGSCDVRPQICTEEYSPVCSCDGKSYSNTCFAASQGANVGYPGACQGQPAPPIQGSNFTCKTANDCPTTGSALTFCWREKGICNAAAGSCFTAPTACSDIDAPVCGCDGKSYQNSCAALSRGINVKAVGLCKGTPNPEPGPEPDEPQPGPEPDEPQPGPEPDEPQPAQ